MARKKQTRKKNKSFHKWLLGHFQFVAVSLILLIFGTAGVAWFLLQSNAATTDIDTSNQAAVNEVYWTSWMYGSGRYAGWTGSVADCKAGTISNAASAAHVRGINFARRMNKLTPIHRAGETATANAQKTALMMEANNKLSHTPSLNWKCYTSAGDVTAAKSNILLSSAKITVEGVIRGYMADTGDSNKAVGHRRWLLNPDSARFAFGMTNRGSAIQVVGVATDSTNANPAYVAWPSAGWFPDTIAPSRWSLSSGNNYADFRYATIKVTRGGTNIPVTKHTVKDGYAKPTLVWEMPSGYAKSGAYTVTVKNIKRTNSSKVFSRQYVVKLFTPTR